MQPSNSTSGVHHVELTVLDLAAARRFLTEVLGYHVRGEGRGYPAAFVTDGKTMVALWQVKDPGRAIFFDRQQNVGLHHLALEVDGSPALDALHRRIAHRSDAEIEFVPEPLGRGPSRHMMLRIGGGLRIEPIAPGARGE